MAVEVINKSYALDGCVGEIIGILFNHKELIAEVVYANVTTGKLIVKNIRQVLPDGTLDKWLLSVRDGVNFDIGLEQNKLFWEPCPEIKSMYEAIVFP